MEFKDEPDEPMKIRIENHNPDQNYLKKDKQFDMLNQELNKNIGYHQGWIDTNGYKLYD